MRHRWLGEVGHSKTETNTLSLKSKVLQTACCPPQSSPESFAASFSQATSVPVTQNCVHGTDHVDSSVKSFSVDTTGCIFLMQRDAVRSQNITGKIQRIWANKKNFQVRLQRLTHPWNFLKSQKAKKEVNCILLLQMETASAFKCRKRNNEAKVREVHSVSSWKVVAVNYHHAGTEQGKHRELVALRKIGQW